MARSTRQGRADRLPEPQQVYTLQAHDGTCWVDQRETTDIEKVLREARELTRLGQKTQIKNQHGYVL